MAHLQTLPSDLLVEILSSCQSIQDLHSLILASRPCYVAFSSYRRPITLSVLKAELGPANYRTLLAILHAPPADDEAGEDSRISVLQPYLKHYISDFEDQFVEEFLSCPGVQLPPRLSPPPVQSSKSSEDSIASSDGVSLHQAEQQETIVSFSSFAATRYRPSEELIFSPHQGFIGSSTTSHPTALMVSRRP